MPSDPRVYAVDHFTTTLHSAPYPTIDPSAVQLPNPFTVCIVGASRGIGAGIAYSYARAGATHLLLCARTHSELSSVAAAVRSLNPAIHVSIHECDITSYSSVSSVGQRLQQADFAGRLDVCVVNSGFSGPVNLKVTDGDPEDFARCFAVNAVGTYHVARALIPLLLGTADGVRAFVAVGSVAGSIVRGPIANTGYCVSKMAQARLVECLAEQYAGDGLLAVAVHPGAVASRMALETSPEVFKKYLVDDPELCGAFCVWLTKQTGQMSWLNGRLVSANWDVEELLRKKDDIVEKRLLQFELITE